MSSPTEEHDLTPMWFLAQPGGSPSGPMPWLELLDRVRASGGAGTWMACPAGGTEWKALSSDPALVASLAPARFDHGIDPMRASAVPPAPIDPNAADHNFLVLLHLSQFAGLIVPLAGIALPIVLWQVNLAKPGVAAHGKEIANWIIFSFAVFFVCAAFFVVTTFAGAICPCMFIFAITWLLYPLISAGYIVCVIVGAVKASKGELFRYPMPVRLLK